MNKIRAYLLRATLLISSGIFFICAFAAEAQAYIDPGSGSQLFQIIIAGLFAALYTIKIHWVRLSEFIKKLFRRSAR